MDDCPNCGSSVREWKDYCEECGADLRGRQSEGGQWSDHPHRQQQRGPSRGEQRHSRGRSSGGGQQQGRPGGQQRQGRRPQRGEGQSQWQDSRDDGTSRRTLLAGGGLAVVAAAGGWFMFLRSDDTESDSGGRGDGGAEVDTSGGSADRPGTSFESAPTVSRGRHGPYQITNGEEHYFAVDLTSGDELVTTMEFDHTGGDLDIDLYDPVPSIRRFSASLTDDESVSLTATESGTHYLKPYGYRGATNSYELIVEIT